VKASVSLWSADQLALGEALATLDGHADGFHIDVMDGHFVAELLYGPDLVGAVADRSAKSPVDVHLLVADADAWIERFVRAGADMLTVHPESCADVAATLRAIERRGVRPALALSLDQPLERAGALLEQVDRVLLMGTEIGVKGVGLDAGACERVERLVALRDASERKPEIVVDGGIRRETVPRLAAAGADGVVPGSLVFGEQDRRAVVSWLHELSREGVATGAVG